MKKNILLLIVIAIVAVVLVWYLVGSSADELSQSVSDIEDQTKQTQTTSPQQERQNEAGEKTIEA